MREMTKNDVFGLFTKSSLLTVQQSLYFDLENLVLWARILY